MYIDCGPIPSMKGPITFAGDSWDISGIKIHENMMHLRRNSRPNRATGNFTIRISERE